MIYKYLIEIKSRFFFAFIAWSFTTINCYFFKETLLFIIIQPSFIYNENNSFYFLTTNVTEIFLTYIHLSYFITNQILVTFLLYQIFVFIAPGLYLYEYCSLRTFLIIIFICWLILITFFNNYIFPTTWYFFLEFQKYLNFQKSTFYFEAKLNEYLNFYESLYLLCNFCFQIMLFLFLMLNQLKNNLLVAKNFRKFFYFLFVLFATLTTPPEVVYQLIISVCIIIVYELIIIYIIFKKEFINYYIGSQLKLINIPTVNSR